MMRKQWICQINILSDDAKVDWRKVLRNKLSTAGEDAARTRYLTFINSANERVAKEAIAIVRKIGSKEGNQSYLLALLQSIDFQKGSLTNLYAMRAINEMLRTTDYDLRITKVYLKALDNSNYNYRIAALKGLKYANDDQLRQSLAYLKDDPAAEVRKAFEEFNQKPLNMGGLGIVKELYDIVTTPEKRKIVGELLKIVAKGGREEEKGKDDFKLK